ncbi:MAG: DUF3784 domain-containing protein [Sarcina sp.]
MGWVFFVMVILFIAMGIAIDKFKCYWLIAGYNTASKEEQENVDIEKMARVMAYFLYVLALLLVIMAIIEPYYPNITIIVPVVIVISTIALVFYCQRFDHNEKSNSKGEKIGMAVLLAIPLITVIITTASATEGNKMVVENNTLVIEGGFGIELPKEDINDVTLLDSMPKVKNKKSGSNLGNYRKGLFTLDNNEVVNLYLESNKGPYLRIQSTKGDFYINFKDSKETKKIYEEIKVM